MEMQEKWLRAIILVVVMVIPASLLVRPEAAGPPIPPGELHLTVPTSPITPERTNNLDFLAEITEKELQRGRDHVRELEEKYLADPVTEADLSSCAPPAPQQAMGDCGAHTVANMLNIQECLEGNWGGNPYPWNPEFSVSALWFTSINPVDDCSMTVLGGLLIARELGAITEDRLPYGDGNCFEVNLTEEDYEWAKPLRVADYGCVFLRDTSNPDNNLGSAGSVIEVMDEGQSAGLSFGVESGAKHGNGHYSC
jgi:hypothetical protein